MQNINIYKAKYFVDNIMDEIHIDRAFQRKVCWSDKTCREFIISANWDETPYPIVVACVETGIRRSAEKLDELSEKKYRAVQGVYGTYISLDGQNRAEAFRRLFNNELTLTGRFVDADGKELNVENKYYKDLPLRLQDALRDMEIGLKVQKGKLYDKLHDIFVKINSGDALNDQEKRNATNTAISSFIRNSSEQKIVAAMWPKISGFKAEKIKRSLDAEWTAKAFMATLPNSKYNLLAKDVNNFYLKGKGKTLQNVPEYSKQNQKRFRDILDTVASIVDGQGQIAQKTWWMCLYAAEVVVDRQHNIIDNSEFYKIIQRIDNQLAHDSRKELGKAIADWEANGKPETDEPTPFNYYYQWASDPGAATRREKRKTTFFASLWSDEEFLALLERSQLAAA